MDEQLHHAIKERMHQGLDKEAIKQEMLAEGYDEQQFEAAYYKASVETEPPVDGVMTPSGTAANGDGASEGQANPTGGLISFSELIERAFSLPFSYLPLFGGAIIATIGLFLLLALVGFITASLGGGAVTTVVFFISYLVSTIGFALIGWTVMRGLLRRNEDPGFWSNFQWFGGHIVGAVVLVVLVQLATSGAMLALILPGIALAIYLTFSFHVFIMEERRGFTALLRSINLVTGDWWGVAIRLVGLAFLLLIAVFAFGFIAALIPFLFILFPVVWLWFMASMAAASVLLFESLQTAKPEHSFDASQYSVVKTLLYIACIVGLMVVTVQLWGAANSFQSMGSYSNDMMVPAPGTPGIPGGM